MVEPEYDWQLLSHDSLLVQQAELMRLQAAKKVIRLEKANSTIKANVIQAITLGLIPVPLLDVIALTNIQFKMLDDLVKLYEIRYTKIEKSVVNAFLLGVLPVAMITGLSSVLKMMPGIGSFAGSTGVSMGSGALTYATGRVFVRHFETGGTLDNFNLEEAKRQFRQEFRLGRQVARDLATTNRLPLPAGPSGQAD